MEKRTGLSDRIEMDPFAEIRPYNDDEVRLVLDKLLEGKDFITTITEIKFPKSSRAFTFILLPLVRAALKREMSSVKDVKTFQDVVKKYMDQMIRETTESFTVSGLNHLDSEKPYLFIGNHRDITLDPAFISYSLYSINYKTPRLAIGDNLLSKAFASDLMRLNKCFIVKRSARGTHQILSAYKNLSAYILHSIEDDRNPVWIAQREGRAKDGNDRTDPAVIKMLAMSRDKRNESFDAFIHRLNIVPVAISYEYDPCDGAKARELYHREEFGVYKKKQHEDLVSIGLGISGQKGAVHVSFGKPLTGNYTTPEAVAEEVDRQVINNYVLHPTNFFAYKKIYGTVPAIPCGHEGSIFNPEVFEKQQQLFRDRMGSMSGVYRKYALAIYANPVVNKLEY